MKFIGSEAAFKTASSNIVIPFGAKSTETELVKRLFQSNKQFHPRSTYLSMESNRVLHEKIQRSSDEIWPLQVLYNLMQTLAENLYRYPQAAKAVGYKGILLGGGSDIVQACRNI